MALLGNSDIYGRVSYTIIIITLRFVKNVQLDINHNGHLYKHRIHYMRIKKRRTAQCSIAIVSVRLFLRWNNRKDKYKLYGWLIMIFQINPSISRQELLQSLDTKDCMEVGRKARSYSNVKK